MHGNPNKNEDGCCAERRRSSTRQHNPPAATKKCWGRTNSSVSQAVGIAVLVSAILATEVTAARQRIRGTRRCNVDHGAPEAEIELQHLRRVLMCPEALPKCSGFVKGKIVGRCSKVRHQTQHGTFTPIPAATADVLVQPHSVPLSGEPLWVNYVTAKFGHNASYKDRVLEHIDAVEKANIFNKTYSFYEFPDFVLKDARFERNIKFLEREHDASSRGGGYWFWKPLIVSKLLDDMDDGEIVVYGDLDRDDFMQTVRKVVDGMVLGDVDFGITFRPQAGDRAAVWSKGDMFEEFYPNVPYDELEVDRHIYANLFVVRNNAQVRKLFAAWTRCVSNWQLVSDEPSRRPNHPDFKENRHDQALLSFLLQVDGIHMEPKAGLGICKECTKPKLSSWRFYTVGRVGRTRLDYTCK